MSLWDIIVWPFARLLEILYNWTDSYGLAIILFALVVNLILLPFMAKSKSFPSHLVFRIQTGSSA